MLSRNILTLPQTCLDIGCLIAHSPRVPFHCCSPSPHSVPILQISGGTTSLEPLADRRLLQMRESSICGRDGARGGGGGRKGDWSGRRTEEISFLHSPSFPLPSLPLGPLRHPQNPDLERVPSYFPGQRHPSKASLAPPLPPPPAQQCPRMV